LPGLMREMVALTRERDIPWVTFGKRSKKGHPHHPLYLRKDSTHCLEGSCSIHLSYWRTLLSHGVLIWRQCAFGTRCEKYNTIRI
ncbi:hypothetical protein R2O95_14160, partial [Faecalibacterium duncaniae]|nr:hypothetical protein [Faecalibacterium duncaniae]